MRPPQTRPPPRPPRRSWLPNSPSGTADLQRVQAEYANYRKRRLAGEDRVAVRDGQGLANVLTELLPILDNIGRAREHDELAGGFKSVAESIEGGGAAKLGLVRCAASRRAVRPECARGADALVLSMR